MKGAAQWLAKSSHTVVLLVPHCLQLGLLTELTDLGYHSNPGLNRTVPVELCALPLNDDICP